MGIRRKSREMIIQTFYALNYTETDEYLAHLDYLNKYKDILNDLASDTDVESDSGIYTFADNLIKNIIPKMDMLDGIVSSNIGDYKIDKIGIVELNILRLAIYEMIFDKTPPPVVINEAIELTKKFCAEKSPSLINAVLDKIKGYEVPADV